MVMKPIVARPIHAALTSLAGVLLATTMALGAPAAGVKTFDSPKQAADALVAAADTFNVPALEQLFGPATKNYILSRETSRDLERAKEFVARARERENVTIDPKNRNRATLFVGKDNWPFPVPIVKRGTKWAFDAAE